MPDSSVPKAVEKLILDAIAARGWTSLTQERRGKDLEVRVECSGVRGRLLFVHDPQGSDDAEFLRIDLGETGGAPELWCITEDNFPVADSEQGRPRQVCQVAIGRGWVSIGAGVFGPSNSGSGEVAPDIDIWRMFAGKLLTRAEQLRPDHDWNERRALMAELRRTTRLPQSWSPRWRAAITGAGVLALLVAWGIDNTWVGIIALAATAYGLLTFGAAAGDHWLTRRRERGLWPGVGPAVRAVFSRFKVTGELSRLVLLPVPGGRHELYRSSAIGRSSQHGMRASFELARIEGPDPAESCRILPKRWITVELAGPETAIGRMPPGPRETRSATTIRWTFTGDELERDLGRRFADVAETLGLVSHSAYR